MGVTCVSNYWNLTSAHVERARDQCNAELQRVKLRRRNDFCYLDDKKQTKAPDGEEVFQLFLWLVEYKLPYRFHYFQRKFFDYILQVLAEYLLGERWVEVSSYYRTKYGWGRMSRVAFAVAARRFGKTITAGQVQAALALARPTEIVTLSTGKRASEGMRTAVLNCINKSDYAGLVGKAKRAEKIQVTTILFPDQQSDLRFLPASPLVRVRGFG